MAAQQPIAGSADVPATDWLTGGYGPPPPPFGSYDYREAPAPTSHNLGPGPPRPDLWEHTTPRAAAIQNDAAEQRERARYLYQRPLLATYFYDPPPIAQVKTPEERLPESVEKARAEFLANAAAHQEKTIPMLPR